MDKPEDAGRVPDPPHYPGTSPPSGPSRPEQQQAAYGDQAGPQPDLPQPDFPQPEFPQPDQPHLSQPRRLRRSHDPKVGGVAAGLGRYVGVEPKVFRIAFVILTLFGGSGLVIYLAGWLLLPNEDDPDPTPLALTSNTVALVVGFIVLALGTLGLFEGETWGLGAEVVIPAALIMAGLWVLNQRSESLTMAGPGPPTGSLHPHPNPHSHQQHQAPPADWAAPSTSSPSSLADDAAASQAQRQRARGAWPPPDSPASNPLETSPPDPIDIDAAWSGGPAPWDSPSAAQPWAVTHPRQQEKPKRVGPPVTSITLASLAVVVGFFLVLSNVGGIAVSATAVLGAALAVIGGGLVASALFERALGLYPLGFLVLCMLAIAPLIDTTLGGGVGTREVRVTSVQALEESYSIGMGELLLDLSRIEPTTDTSVEVDVGAGFAEITVPADVRVEVRARSRAGYVEAFRISDEGVLNDLYQVSEGTDPDGPTLTVEADVTFGYVEVNRG